MRGLIVAIQTLSLQQQHQYQQSQTFRREITKQSIDIQDQPMQNNALSSVSGIIEMSDIASVVSDGIKAINTNSINQQAMSEDVYLRPLPVEIKAIKLILDRFFHQDFNFESNFFDFYLQQNTIYLSSQRLSINELSSVNQQSVNNMLTIDQQQFNAGDILLVEQWQTNTQSLSFKMQAELAINDQNISIDYSFSLKSEHVSYLSFETNAAALKDPILVQFGSQGLGEISGESDFDINNDNALNKLPIFSGDVGYLVYDINQNGKADNGTELFGPQTGNGFTEMAKLDSNHNGFIDQEDEHFDKLYLWKPGDEQVTGDLETEQITNQGQWISLSDIGIYAINLAGQNSPYSFYDQQGEIQAQLRQSSFALNESGNVLGVHQIDVRI